MLHVFELAFYFCSILYALLEKPILIAWFVAFVAVYMLIAAFYPSAKTLSTRRKFVLATWPAPREGLIYNNISLRVDKLLEFI